MAVMIGVFLCEIDYYIKCKEVKILKILPYAIGLTTAFFLKKTQSTTATLAILCGALCWGIEKILKRHMKNYDRSDVFCDMLYSRFNGVAVGNYQYIRGNRNADCISGGL